MEVLADAGVHAGSVHGEAVVTSSGKVTTCFGRGTRRRTAEWTGPWCGLSSAVAEAGSPAHMPKKEEAKSGKKLPRLNADWHRAHRMPKNPSLARRIAWHEEHACVCGCRPMPDSIAAAIRARSDAED
jgi:hypothetical protein